MTQLNSTQLNSTQLNSTQLNSTQLNSTQLNSTHADYVDQRFFVKPFYKGFLAFFAGNLFFNAIFFASAKEVA
ncbi:hypothetical protein [Limosilactobacillus allomucosae]|uniref:hypothetical protein n=1 Tax=Limosilactobacillus allomucosae TaxID=3142938 RepID=UPI003264A1C1